MSVRRTDLRSDRLVYVIVAQRPQRYPYKSSCIVYIGTTKKGLGRIAASAAQRADQVLRLHGVREFQVRVITCQARQGVKTWQKLERALLLRFREKHGDVPVCNRQGTRMQERDEFAYFKRERLDVVLSGMEA
jgi:hypothetical protein